MSKNLPDIEEARLSLTHCTGIISGLERAERFMMADAAKAFTLSKDSDAKLLRSKAAMFHQEIEVMDVKRAKLLKELEDLEKIKEDS